MTLIQEGVSVKDISQSDVVSEMVRLKSAVPNKELVEIDDYLKRLEQELMSIKSSS